MKKLNIDITDNVHTILKVHTAYRKKTVKDFVTEAILDKIESEKELNEETIKTLEESRQGIGLTTYNSREEFVEWLKQVEKEAKEELEKEAANGI